MTERADQDLLPLYVCLYFDEDVSVDRDFELRHERTLEQGKTHYGIIIARRHPNDAAVVSRLLALLNSVSAEEMLNQLRYI
jgi:hypothetical protein